MKNSNKDKYEHKLYKFVKEMYKLACTTSYDSYLNESKRIRKKFNFTEEDVQKAYAYVRSVPFRDLFWNGIGIKKLTKNAKEKVDKKLEKDLQSGKQDYFNELGEKTIKMEDDWTMDVFDSYYDDKDMHT